MSAEPTAAPSAARTPWAEFARALTDPAQAMGKPEALDDLLVLDCSQANVAGLFASSILAEFGATVIRVEPPGGDVARQFSADGLQHVDTGLAYLVEGRNKHHVTLSLEHAEGRLLLRRLAAKADVLIETARPGQMDAWGLGYRQLSQLNPGLVYVAISTYGQFGPRAASPIPDHDLTNQALSGVACVTGEPEPPGGPQPHAVPTRQGNWAGWYFGGAWAAFSAMVALAWRATSGRGQFCDVSPAEGEGRAGDYAVHWYHSHRQNWERGGAFNISVFPYTLVQTKDGYAFVAGFSDVNWTGLTSIMGQPGLKDRFPTIRDRLDADKQPEIHRELEAWSSQLTSQELLEKVMDYMLNKRGPGTVATARVNSPKDTLAEGHWWERGVFQRVEDPHYGTLLLQAPPWKMSRTPPRIKWACRPVGADNAVVYALYLGLPPSELEALRARGVI
jgi:crotonobetainyl-CoA:carnitine CoA-transferase CaiB-like acyl-CoA transferase